MKPSVYHTDGETKYWVLPNTKPTVHSSNQLMWFTGDTVGSIHSTAYCNYGILHRTDGPALVSEGGIAWCINGKLHRIGAPAFTDNVQEIWSVKGKLHREDGPAVKTEVRHCWLVNGKRHRLDGPAVVSLSTGPEYFVNGKCYPSGMLYNRAVANWLSYKDITREEIKQQIGNFKIVEWE